MNGETVHDVFVYGTLTDPDRAAAILSAYSFGPDARIDGLHRIEGAYPTLAPGGSVEGKILRTADIDALDAYEGVERGLYARVWIPYSTDRNRRDSSTEVAVYVGRPTSLGVDVDWPGTGEFGERVRRYVDSNAIECLERY